ncbi:MAG: methyltransferase domain-containing protein [Caulobacteraceae bacterium]
MTGSKDVRLQAAQFYEAALKTAEASSCAAAAPNAFAAAAGYTQADLGGMPDDAALNSFGCGNPMAFAQVSPGQTVVDLGSGAGIDLLIAARAVGEAGRVIGIDLSEVMLARARENVSRAGLGNVEPRQGAIEQLPVETGCADWVISNCVINLSPDKRAVFREIHRVLKPGGRVLVSDIVADGLPGWFRDDPNLRAACLSGALPEHDYLAAARAGGLVGVEIIDWFAYDDEQVSALVSAMLPASLDTISATPGQREDVVQKVVAAAHGRVASVRVAARRPI